MKLVLIVIVVVIVIIAVLCLTTFSSSKKEEPVPETFQEPQIIEPPVEEAIPEAVCQDATGKLYECGEGSIREPVHLRGKFPFLKLRNASGVDLEIHYIQGEKNRYRCAVLPVAQYMYVYGAGKDLQVPFEKGGILVARIPGAETDLFEPYDLTGSENTVTFGVAESTTIHSRLIYNLKGEIMFIEFINVSRAYYDLEYYGNKLGTLCPAGEDGFTLRTNNGSSGFRLNSYVSFTMRGSNVKQRALLDNPKMSAMVIGKVAGTREE